MKTAAPSLPASPPPAIECASDWIRIFATWFARKRPNLSAEDVVARAIREFETSRGMPPEQAADHCSH